MLNRKKLSHIAVICVLIAISFILIAQNKDKKPSPSKVNQQRVDAAIKRGAAFLLSNNWATFQLLDYNNVSHTMRSDELIFYTVLHAGLKQEDIDKIAENILKKPLDRVYHVALRAMALEALDRVKYQEEIRNCAQFLIDNQCANGQWSYGTPTDLDKAKITPSGKKGTVTGEEEKEKTPSKDSKYAETVKKIQIRKRRNGPRVGDNSNSQYAALGLRACMQAGIDVPIEVLTKGAKWWRDSQLKDGGWNYSGAGTIAGNPPSYGSMTAGGVGCLCIYDFYLKQNTKSDQNIQKGLKWLEDNFTVKENSKASDNGMYHYYFLYAMERAGILADTEFFGKSEWYSTGAEYLLTEQRENGCWKESPIDTCFAILFLRRATKPLKATITGDK